MPNRIITSLLIIITAFCNSHLKAQAYYPVLDPDSVTWSLSYYGEDHSFGNSVTALGKDTVEYHGTKYRKVLDVGGGSVIGLVREENKRIFFWSLEYFDTAEKVVYDFNLKENDTFTVNSPKYSGPMVFICIRIDSVHLRNGSYRKHYNFQNVNRNREMCMDWTEDVLTTRCLPFTYLYNNEFNISYGVNCIFLGDTLVYSNGGCNASIKTSRQDSQLPLYPNPADNILQIDLNEPNLKIQILSVEGKMVYSYNYKIFNNELDISALPAGLYFILVQTDEKIYTDKFVKN
jgi:hypothetical protein